MDDCPRQGVPEHVPTLAEIKREIPKHLFTPQASKSLRYALSDLCMICVLYGIMRFCLEDRLSVLFPLYWFIQGTWMWAFFVVGHDCGHGSFSRYPWLNDIVGTLIFAMVLTPYYAWKLSHNHHHKNTGNYQRDEVFFPVFKPVKEHSMLALFVHTKGYFGLGLGYVTYLLFGYGGLNSCTTGSHIVPSSPIFRKKHLQVLGSVLATGIVFYLSILYGLYDGWWRAWAYYYTPLLCMATWLVVTTFLHHGTSVPWYSDEAWDYVRGNLSAVDRDIGILQPITHNISTHQIHHLFPAIPHYHLQEATKHFRMQFPQLVRFSSRPVWQDFLRSFTLYAKHFASGTTGTPKVFMYPNQSRSDVT